AHDSTNINRILHRLRRLNNASAYPLLLNLLIRLRDGSISEADFSSAADLIETFLKQMQASTDSPRNLSRWFANACRILGDEPVKELEAFLVD
ncbi:MAG: hypothetical protein AAF633_06175, partial [Chloroflexota bacterium]